MAAKKPAAKTAAKKETNKESKTKNTSTTTAKSTSTTGGTKEKSLNELISALAERTGVTKAQIKTILDAHAELLVEELKQSKSVQLAGIGKLKMGERGERQGRNPATGEAMTIKASKTVKFSGGKRFKDSFNG
jgi:DNA-binding protein HU-beta